ncbi:hypothetical protein [Streptomyces sp. NRRL S-813]|uniref:hypothetical protein n=1 Tax=Streptomyces sp. NRRL S-813 TaxID=1463919 RepID=UPI00068DC7D2|nr:hypothetical protein [Streptomyces sp. NRRL S-813]
MPRNTVPGLTREKPEYTVVEVTPKLAEKWLKQNTHNRKVRENAVFGYARDMEAGKWAENGEAIKFAKDGTLLDGQHRLHAIVLSGVTLRMLVVTGLEIVTQETMDDGRKRTVADALTLRGVPNAVQLAAITRRALMWKQGVYRNVGSRPPTNAETLTFLGEHPELKDSTSIAVSLRKAVALPSSVVGLTHWLFSAIDKDDTDWFFDRLGTGANLEQFHPVWTLRKRAYEISNEPGRVPEDMLLAFVIKAWNAYRDGSQLRLLRFTPGGANPEKFPQPK